MKKVLCILCFVFAMYGNEHNRYAVITLENHTPFRVYYSYKWGEGNTWWRNSLAPDETYVHWWTLKNRRKPWAPWFYLKTEGDQGWYKLASFYSPNTSAANGRLYRFSATLNDEGTWEINLDALLYTE